MRHRPHGLSTARAVAVLAALAPAALPSWATAAALGASLGVLFPTDRLTNRAGPLGATLRPGPTVGAHAGPGADRETRPLGWDVSVELAQFESDGDPDLRALYVPLKGGIIWQAVSVQGVGLEARLAGGAALMSARSRDAASTVLPVVSFGGALRHPIHRLSAALEFEAGALLERRPQATFQVRLVLQTR